MIRHRSLLGISLLAVALGADSRPPDYEAIRRRRLAAALRDLRAEGLTAEEAVAEVERLDGEAKMMAGVAGSDWSWAFDLALQARRAQVRAEARVATVLDIDASTAAAQIEAVISGPREAAPVDSSAEARSAVAEALDTSRMFGRAVIVEGHGPIIDIIGAEPVGFQVTSASGMAAAEVNRRRREAGELGTRRQRMARKRRAK